MSASTMPNLANLCMRVGIQCWVSGVRAITCSILRASFTVYISPESNHRKYSDDPIAATMSRTQSWRFQSAALCARLFLAAGTYGKTHRSHSTLGRPAPIRRHSPRDAGQCVTASSDHDGHGILLVLLSIDCTPFCSAVPPRRFANVWHPKTPAAEPVGVGRLDRSSGGKGGRRPVPFRRAYRHKYDRRRRSF